jgi:hypothetical protein
MKKLIFKQLLVLATFVFVSCNPDDNSSDNDNPQSEDPYKTGVFISNEGPFQSGTGTITFFNQGNKNVEQEIFQTVNARPLGNIVQSIDIYNDKAYIVVNNAAKVEVVKASTFESQGVITDLDYPRYFKGINSGKGYVSDYGGYIAVIDLSTNSIQKKIQTDRSPEQMIMIDNKIFTVNMGGWGVDSTITVVDVQKDSVINTIYVDYRPNSLQLDVNNKLWVLCAGKSSWTEPADESEGHLICINTNDYIIEKNIAFPLLTDHPQSLVINQSKDKLFYINSGKVFDFDISSNSLNTNVLLNRYFYSIGYDNITDYLYCSDPVDYVQDGWIYRYGANNGNLIDSLKAGIIPGGFCFK